MMIPGFLDVIMADAERPVARYIIVAICVFCKILYLLQPNQGIVMALVILILALVKVS